MAAKRQSAPAAQWAAGTPPWYEATEDILIFNPDAGSAPVAAARKGDRVTADVVEANGWHDKVQVPNVFLHMVTPPGDSLPADEPEAPASADEAGKE